MRIHILLFLSTLIILSACSDSRKEPVDLLILNATILDIRTGEEFPGKTIAIKADTILSINDKATGKDYAATKTIDAGNNYVMPGLWDMHVHFRGGDSLISENKGLLPLFLDHGVTTVRDAGGDINLSVLEWRNKIEKGELTGPSIFTSGPKLDGANPAWPGSIRVGDMEDIPEALDSLEQLQVDYVKMYDGSLSKEVFYGIIAAAEKRGLKTTGHMPLSADFMKGVELGLDGSEHLYYVLKACSPEADSLTAANPGYGMMNRIVDTYDPQLAKKVFQELGSRQVYITPTLHIGKTLSEILEVDHSKDSLLSYIGSGIQKTYRGRVEGAKRAKAAGSTMRSQMERKSMEMIKPMYDNGVPLLAGSDCGPFNSYVYPGASLLSELERLTNAGLEPREALSTSVIYGPAFFGLENYYGSVEAGKVADLLILKKNPLEKIENLRQIHSVIKKGKLYERKK